MSAMGTPVTVVASGGAPVTPVGLTADMVLADGDQSVQEALDAQTTDITDLQDRSPRIIAAGVGTGTTTGNTNENTQATITIPGGAMGPNGRVVVDTLWSATNNANGKSIRVKFGGTNLAASAAASTQSFRLQCQINNRNNAASQVATSAPSGFGGTAAAQLTATVNTASDVTILITGQLTNSADSLVLEAYTVTLIPDPAA